MSTWRGIEDMPVLEKPLHDPNANAPFDIPEHEKEKAQRMWDHIFQNSPDMNTVLLKANPLDGSADPDDAHIITFCVPFEPRKPSTLKETKYEVLNGVVTLEAVDDAETPRASYSFKQETLHHLCLPCLDAFDYFFQYLKDKKSKNDDEEQSNHRTKPANAVVHHFSAVSLMLSDKKNCYLCRQLLRQLPEHFTKTPWLEKARLEMCWSGGVDSSEPFALFFAVCRPDWTRNQWNYYNYFKLRMWPANSHAKHFVPHESANTTHEADLLLDASRSLFSEENPDGLRIMGVDPRSSMNLGSDCNPLGITAQMQKPAIAGSSTNSIRTKQLALQWFSHCRQNKDGAHNECNIRLGTTLPARLLDVERALKTGMLTLINTKDQPTCFYIEPQPYVTLSYCWGEGGKEKLPLLLSTNLLERETIGLKLADLPRTIRDAVEISSWFNGM
jgi:hypothetical protein